MLLGYGYVDDSLLLPANLWFAREVDPIPSPIRIPRPRSN